jgi:CheY-like chemotaxis protein
MLISSRPLPDIVTVDDNADDLLFTRRLLAKAGVENRIVSFQLSEAALVHLRAAASSPASRDMPCAVLLDLNMPRLDGADLVKELRAMPEFAGVKLVVVSGSSSPEDRERVTRAGADAYFEKYPVPCVLLKAIQPG